jgi:hypothetical protein
LLPPTRKGASADSKPAIARIASDGGSELTLLARTISQDSLLQCDTLCDCPTGKSRRFQIVACLAPFEKIFLFFRTTNQSYVFRHPVPLEGRSRSSRTWGGMRWTRAAPKTKALSRGRQRRVVLIFRRWDQVCDKKRRRRWPKSPAHRGERVISRKPLRGECRVIPV